MVSPFSLPLALNSPRSPLPWPLCFNSLPVYCHHLQATISSRVGTVSASSLCSAPSTVVNRPSSPGHSAPGTHFQVLGWLPGISSLKEVSLIPSVCTPGLAKLAVWGCQRPVQGLGLLTLMTVPVSRHGKARQSRLPVNVAPLDFSFPAPAASWLLHFLFLCLESGRPGTKQRRTARGHVP